MQQRSLLTCYTIRFKGDDNCNQRGAAVHETKVQSWSDLVHEIEMLSL